MRILIADDERDISDALGAIFKYHKYDCDVVYNGKDALELSEKHVYDAIILDIMMPLMDGIETLRRLRENEDFTPVILLTAKGETEDKINGLNVGADDYIAKPFDSGELVARVGAAIRRKESYSPNVLTFGNIAFNEKENLLYNQSASLRIAGKESRLLAFFIRNAGKPVSEKTLIERFWNGETPKEGAVDLYIGYIRNKLRSVSENTDIERNSDHEYYLREL